MDPVGICNLALAWIGQKAITQLDVVNPVSATEELCARVYPEALRAVLEARAWTFATKREEFAPATATGLADFPSKYPVPSTIVRVLACDDGSGSYELEWRREGAFVLTQTSPTAVYAKVTTLEEDASKFPPGFGRAVAARVAADIAGAVTENRALQQLMEERFQFELREAGRRDGMQGTSERQRSSGLAARRW